MEYWKVKLFNNNVKVAQTFGKTPDEALAALNQMINDDNRERRYQK